MSIRFTQLNSTSKFENDDVIALDGATKGSRKMSFANLQNEILGGGSSKAAIQEWLDNHPEATTTVEDNSITDAKLSSNLIDKLSFSVSNIEALRLLNAEKFVGKLISTRGYYTESDGGNAQYIIHEGTKTDDGFLTISINNTYYAELKSIEIKRLYRS